MGPRRDLNARCHPEPRRRRGISHRNLVPTQTGYVQPLHRMARLLAGETDQSLRGPSPSARLGMTRISWRETLFHDFGGANLLQISGELVCFRASLKESDMAIGTNQVEERTSRAVQAREISIEIFEAFCWWHLCAVRRNDERPDMQRRECAGNFLAVL